MEVVTLPVHTGADTVIFRVASTNNYLFTIVAPLMRSFLWGYVPDSWKVRPTRQNEGVLSSRT